MSEALAKVMRAKKGEQPQGEKRALATLQREAKEAGATLLTEGEGGLPSSTVLGVMRRDKFRCKRCGKQENLSLHHKGHMQNPVSRWLKKKAKSNEENNIVTICGECHDSVHEEDREEGGGDEK